MFTESEVARSLWIGMDRLLSLLVLHEPRFAREAEEPVARQSKGGGDSAVGSSSGGGSLGGAPAAES